MGVAFDSRLRQSILTTLHTSTAASLRSHIPHVHRVFCQPRVVHCSLTALIHPVADSSFLSPLPFNVTQKKSTASKGHSLAPNSKMIRSDLADRISFLFPGASEIVSLALGIILGALLFATFQRKAQARHHRHARRDVEARPQMDDHKHPLNTDVDESRNQASHTHGPLPKETSNNVVDPLSPQPLPPSSSQPLDDLPPPLRTTIHNPHDDARPWTSADFIEQYRLHKSANPSPWKRHTMPAMHITDHVHYYPTNSDISTSAEAQGSEVDPLSQRLQWRRRRILTFEPLLPSTQISTEPDTMETVVTTGSTLESFGSSSQREGDMNAPITALQVEIEQRGVPPPTVDFASTP